MRNDTRDRLVLPILLPVGILAVIVLVLFLFSRILLAAEGTPATAIALVVAFAIMVVAGIAASRSMVRASTLAAMTGAIAGVAMLAGGLALIAVGEEEGPGEGGEGGGAVVALSAKDLQFSPASLSAPAGEAFTIEFDNQDAGVQHNVVIYDNESFEGEPLFRGDLIAGVDSIGYEVPALEAGTYYFLCEVHPDMTGQITVEEGGGGGGGGPALTVTAASLAFDTDTITLEAGATTTITFDNQDAGVQHNIAIYADDSLGEPLFVGDVITGPDQIAYEIPPLEPGTYYFQCDIHPGMNGTVVVEEGGGGGSPGPSPTEDQDGGGDGGTAVEIAAEGVAFDTDTLSFPAGQPVTLRFANHDAGVQHNLSIYTDDTLATALFQGEIFAGVETRDYPVPALDPGSYYFQCDVHPPMSGTVQVG